MHNESKILYFKELYLKDFEAGDIILFNSRNLMLIIKKEPQLVEWIKIEHNNPCKRGSIKNAYGCFAHYVFLIRANPIAKEIF